MSIRTSNQPLVPADSPVYGALGAGLGSSPSKECRCATLSSDTSFGGT